MSRTGYTNTISDIDQVTDNPDNYTSSILRQAVRDAYVVYQEGNKSKAWYEQVKRICNATLEERGESPVS